MRRELLAFLFCGRKLKGQTKTKSKKETCSGSVRLIALPGQCHVLSVLLVLCPRHLLKVAFHYGARPQFAGCTSAMCDVAKSSKWERG